ncbi:MAG: pyridoxal-phosphate dependent enzyme, partial [Actinobacteria bacterium]|nr:pyridoxal-phosphate dependent enzyme [Actinomycetota bacterium]
PDSPRSYYSVAKRLAEEVPGAFQPNQYFNQANPEAHYKTTGPEIWEQTEGKVAAFVAGVGTGGTITGVGRYLKERNPEVLIVGADPEGSIYTQPDDIHPYLAEGIGEDFYPETFDRSIVDRWEKISDVETFTMTRRITREEGILVGGSCGTAVVAALRVGADLPQDSIVVVLLPDGGRSYLSKIYNDNWLTEHGFLERRAAGARVGDVLETKSSQLPGVVHVHPHERVEVAIEIMHEFGVSQLPVMRSDDAEHAGDVLGSIRERDLLEVVLKEPDAFEKQVIEVMQPPMPMVDVEEEVDSLVANLGQGASAVVVMVDGKPSGVITRSDLLTFLSKRSAG